MGLKIVKFESYSEEQVKGIQLSVVLVYMFVASVIASCIALYTINNVSNKYTSMIDSMNDYVMARDNIEALQNASDHLTDQVRQFVITEDVAYIYEYFDELHSGRREKAVKGLSEIFPDDDAYMSLLQALNESNSLAEQEMYAMKLIIHSKNLKVEGIPELDRVELSDTDSTLNSLSAASLANDMVFGSKYSESKSVIIAQVNETSEQIKKLADDKQKESADDLDKALSLQTVGVIILISIIAISFMLMYFSVIRQLKEYLLCVKSQSKLPESGMFEFRYLARTYNTMFDRNLRNHNKLVYKAEHDALTKLLNCTAFNSLKRELVKYQGSITLILIDIDKFKEINDNFGHESGDLALKIVADSLKRSFRENDYIIRYGGDEFIIIMLDVSENDRDMISHKIAEINRHIKRDQDYSVGYDISLSAGIAFSESGYNDELFAHADKALYHIKQNGRGGCINYEDI